MSSGLFKNFIYKMYLEIIFNMYKKDLVLNDLKWLICYNTKPNQIIYIYISNIYV